MIKKFLLPFLRHYFRSRTSFFIIFLELVVGFSTFILVCSYLNYELSYDRHLGDVENIYRLNTHYNYSKSNEIESIFTSPVMAPLLKSQVPEVSVFLRLLSTNQVIESTDFRNLEFDVFWTDSSFFNVFQLEFVKGNAQTALSTPNSAVITESIARKYFGDRNPLGLLLKVGDAHVENYKVSGVIEDNRPNTHLDFDILLSNHTKPIFESRSPADLHVISYVKIDKNALLHHVEESFCAIIDSWGIPDFDSNKYWLQLQPLVDIHLSNKGKDEIAKSTNAQELLFIGMVAIVILILASLNYVNLIALDGEQREREFCIRKICGAQRWHLICRILWESLFFVSSSIIVSLVLVVTVLPAFNSLLGIEVYLSPVFLVIISLSLLFMLGGISVLHPASVISRVNPVSVLKRGDKALRQRLGYRRLITICQLAISLIVAVCAVVILQQMNLIQNENHGYSKENVFVTRATLNAGDNEMQVEHQSIKQELLKQVGIETVSCCDAVPELGGAFRNIYRPLGKETEKISAYTYAVDYDYCHTLNLDIVKGRFFSREFGADNDNRVVVNEVAVRELGLVEPVGQKLVDLSSGKRLEIIGVVDDFNYRSLYYEIDPLVISLKTNDFNFFAVKVQRGIINASDIIQKVILDFNPGYYFAPFTLSSHYQDIYRKEKVLLKGFNVLLILVFLITGIGLYIFSNSIAQKQRKNIAIRKVLGASQRSVFMLFIKDVLLQVFIAMMIGVMVSYYLVELWLQNFAEAIDLTIMLFGFPALVIVCLTILIVLISASKIMRANPVDYLSQES